MVLVTYTDKLNSLQLYRINYSPKIVDPQKILTYSENIRLGCKRLNLINPQAYYYTELMKENQL
jgi:hypothetical protein